jgi:deoxyribose-phosphate aldolase
MEKEYAEEIQQIVEVAHGEGMAVKVMLEFGFLDEKQKIRACELSNEAGVDWVKQSSGWGKGGCAATVEDVALLAAHSTPPCRVKVSGKVNTLEKMRAMFEAGAELVGTSSGPAIVDGRAGDAHAY